MSERDDLQHTGDRIAELLDELAALPDRRAGRLSEELAFLMSDLYGAGLERVIAIAAETDAPRGPALVRRLADDPLVESLLLVHDLHPDSLTQRVDQAVSDLRGSLVEADLRVVDLDEATSTLRLRLLCSSGSPAMAASLETEVRRVLEAAAPDLDTVEIDRLLPSTPVHLGRRPAQSQARASADLTEAR